MNQKQAFIKALQDDPDDAVTRQIFADWLEDNNELYLANKVRSGGEPIIIGINDEKLFNSSRIAQADSGGYDPNGYIVVRVEDWCAITTFGHCSCYGTWSAITGGGINQSGNSAPEWLWEGTYDALLEMAKMKADPAMPLRESNPKDHDYQYLVEVYDQILEHDKLKRKVVLS